MSSVVEELERSKMIGGVGAILLVIGSLAAFLSAWITILSIIGLILVLIAMKSFSEVYGEKSIFSNALYGFIFGIIGVIIFIVAAFAAIAGGLISLSLAALIGGLIVAWIVLVVFIILQAVFYRRAFKLLAEKSGEKLFDTAGLLMLIGAVLTIIIIGGILTLIAWILAAVAFFSIKPPPAAAPSHPLHLRSKLPFSLSQPPLYQSKLYFIATA